jgi:hypothetical protein
LLILAPLAPLRGEGLGVRVVRSQVNERTVVRERLGGMYD